MVIAGFMSGMPIGATDKDAFREETSFLKRHCKTLNWDDEEDHRIVASILVNSVYLLEKERPSTLWRQAKNLLWKPKSYSKDWWEAVGFKKIDEFFEGGHNIFGPPSFGTIFQYSPSKNVDARWSNTANAPAFVIAFRGTTNLWDILLDLPVANDFDSLDRLRIAKEKVKNFFGSSTYKNLKLTQGRTNPVKVWITGHSLGGTTAISAAMGLIEAKPMPIQLSEFKTLLFNPPFSTMFMTDNAETLFAKLCKKLGNIIGDLLQEVLPVKKGDIRESLYDWYPHIYVNPGDFISCGFIPYFRERNNNKNIQHLGKYYRASDGTDVGLAFNWTASKSLQLLPSGVLHVNSGMTNVLKNRAEMEEVMKDSDRNSWLPNFLLAHQLRQWWKPTLKLDPPETYRINDGSTAPASKAGQR